MICQFKQKKKYIYIYFFFKEEGKMSYIRPIARNTSFKFGLEIKKWDQTDIAKRVIK